MMTSACSLGSERMKQRNTQTWLISERARKHNSETALFFFKKTVSGPQRGFSLLLKGSLKSDLLLIEMNRSNIATPYNSIPGTDGRVIWANTLPNPPLSHVLRHSEGRKRTATQMTPFESPSAHTRSHTFTYTLYAQTLPRGVNVTVGFGANWFHAEQGWDPKQQKRCKGSVFLDLALILQSECRVLMSEVTVSCLVV